MTTDHLTNELAAYIAAFATGTTVEGVTIVTGGTDDEQDFPQIAITDAGSSEFNPEYGCLRANASIELTTIPGESGEETTQQTPSQTMSNDLWDIVADKTSCPSFITGRGIIKVFDIPSVTFRTEAESDRRVTTFDCEYVVCPL